MDNFWPAILSLVGFMVGSLMVPLVRWLNLKIQQMERVKENDKSN